MDLVELGDGDVVGGAEALLDDEVGAEGEAEFTGEVIVRA